MLLAGKSIKCTKTRGVFRGFCVQKGEMKRVNAIYHLDFLHKIRSKTRKKTVEKNVLARFDYNIAKNEVHLQYFFYIIFAHHGDFWGVLRAEIPKRRV